MISMMVPVEWMVCRAASRRPFHVSWRYTRAHINREYRQATMEASVAVKIPLIIPPIIITGVKRARTASLKELSSGMSFGTGSVG